MINRRNFLRQGMAGLAGLSILPQLISSCKEAELRGNIGLILNTVKKEMKSDWEGTLHKLKEMGFSYIESGIPEGVPEKEFKKTLKELKMPALCGGGAMAGMLTDTDNYLSIAEKLEYECLVCYYPWMTSPDGINREAVMKATENLNALGETCRKAGFNFAWHAHNWEFTPLSNGELPIELIHQNTDPKLVSLELDVYWACYAGVDIPSFFDRYADRISMLHVKDMRNDEEKSITCVGEGIIPFDKILTAALKKGITRWIIENETDSSNIQCAQTGINYLQTV